MTAIRNARPTVSETKKKWKMLVEANWNRESSTTSMRTTVGPGRRVTRGGAWLARRSRARGASAWHAAARGAGRPAPPPAKRQLFGAFVGGNGTLDSLP